MSSNPFGAVSDYPSMLNKIALYTLGVSILAMFLLTSQVPAIEAFLGKFAVSIPIGDFSLPLGKVLPAFIFALGSRVIKLHDKLSDLFGIRQRFDIHEILIPLAVGASVELTIPRLEKIRSHRRHLMGKVFYKYMSSNSNDKAVIDTHSITMAFDQWSWYWILLEANTVATIVASVLLFEGKSLPAALILILVLLIIWALQGVRASCSRYAMKEVNEILSDGTRKRDVAEEFNALLG